MGDRFPALPPRPHPETGVPFPPPGRAFQGEHRRPELDRDRETRLSHKPKSPQGMGPVLVWYKESKYNKITSAVWVLGVFAVGLTILSLLRGDGGFDWISVWPAWVLISVFTLLAVAPLSYSVYAAGADWFKVEIVKFGIARHTRVVKLYELKKITCEFVPPEWYLHLRDRRGLVDLTILEFQHDRRIWDLVYNGILHSVAAGAQLNELALKKLELDQVPELRNPGGDGSGSDDAGDDQLPSWAYRVDRG